MNRVRFRIGDYSGDGHGRSEDIWVYVNKTMKELRELYSKTCEDSGLYFGGLYFGKAKHYFSEYGESTFEKEIIPEKYESCFEHADLDMQGMYYFWPESLVETIMKMIKIYDSSFSYSMTEEDSIDLFNPWGTEVMGYGFWD